MYAAILFYGTVRLDWVDSSDIDASSLGTILAGALASYLLGHLAYKPTRWLDRLVPGRPSSYRTSRQQFRKRNPEAATRRFVDLDQGVLRAATEAHSAEASTEIARL